MQWLQYGRIYHIKEEELADIWAQRTPDTFLFSQL